MACNHGTTEKTLLEQFLEDNLPCVNAASFKQAIEDLIDKMLQEAFETHFLEYMHDERGLTQGQIEALMSERNLRALTVGVPKK